MRNDFRPEVRSLLKDLKAEGFNPSSYFDGEESIDYNSVSKADFLESVVSVDEGWLYVERNGTSHVLFLVLGNDPGELVNDYTLDKDGLVEKVVNQHYEKWEGRKQPIV